MEKQGTISAPAERTGGNKSERSPDFVAAYAAISSTLCVDFVAATAAISFAVLPGAVRLPMDWDEGMLRPKGNEIRFADEIHRRWTISPPQAGTISSLRSDWGKRYLNRGGEGGG